MEELSDYFLKKLIPKLEKRYSNIKFRVDAQQDYVTHGRVVKILLNTYCNIKIVIFERGNEFVTENVLMNMIK